jgi:ubiquitin thioesterase OTU1
MIDILCHYNNEVFNIKISHDDTLLVLKQLIISNLSSKKIMTESSNLKIIYGFPEKSIDNDDLDNLSLEDLSIFDKEYIKVELKNQNSNKENTSNNNMIDYSQYHIKKKDIPADNSCLFNAINFAINGSAENPEIIRDIIVSEISSNPDQYNAAILGRPPEEYCKWISNKETWGGGIELSILSKFFNIQIGVADIQFITIEYFGNSNKCIYLLYNNIHYDVFYKEENGKISGIFDTYDANIKREVMDICMQFQKFENFTDLKNFDIKCMQCGELMKGQNEVIEHSKKTGHFNFNEIKK